MGSADIGRMASRPSNPVSGERRDPRNDHAAFQPINEWDSHVGEARLMFARTLERWAWDVLQLRKAGLDRLRWPSPAPDAEPFDEMSSPAA